MYKGSKVTVIIGAAGAGKRFGSSVPKQFLKIQGDMVLSKATRPFQTCSEVDEIVVVAPGEHMELCRKIMKEFPKVSSVVEGGAERQDSIYLGVKASTGDILLVHDGARPFVSQEVIKGVMEKAWEAGAAVPVVPLKDTIRLREGDGSRTLERDKLAAVQTPQCFRREILEEALEKAFAQGFYGTDEAMLVERLGRTVSLTQGGFANIKITTREDLPGWERTDMRVGTGFDVHRFQEGRKLILCGVEIPYEKGLLGHSDADVALHALSDALLGAAALGDIGKHFPDNDERYRGADSLVLLKEVAALLEREGYTIGNTDITIICQAPKLAGYIEEMREKLSEALKLDISRVSVKATTTEKLGFTGRGEGIAAEAVCTIIKDR